MKTVLVTGSHGLVGAECVRRFCGLGWRVFGIDNDTRAELFGESASTRSTGYALQEAFPGLYIHVDADICDGHPFPWRAHTYDLIIHCAAQPSHDWAASDPLTDFAINATGTLTLLELARQTWPAAPFIFCSTNKVYGATPNTLLLSERPTRWEPKKHSFGSGIDETMSVDQTTHSLFGCSKLAADVLVQEYGRYFGMKTVCFRGGCLTGPGHAGAEQHGFLSYLCKCLMTDKPYTIYGHKGKQVRDNIHVYDLVSAFIEFANAPRSREVYNIGGGRERSCSVLEAIALAEEISGKKLRYSYVDEPRKGDHIWWITDVGKFRRHYPNWSYKYSLRETIAEIITSSSLLPSV